MYGLIFFSVCYLSSSSNSQKSKIDLHLTELKKPSPPSLPKPFPALVSSVVQPQQRYPPEGQYYQSDFLKHKSDYTLSVGFNL